MLPSERGQTFCRQDKNLNLEGQPEGLVGGPAGGNDGVKSLKKGHAVGLAFLPLDVPALNIVL